MCIFCIYYLECFIVGSQIVLSDDVVNYVGCVLCMIVGQYLQFFDGSNQVFDVVIIEVGKKNVMVEVFSGEFDDWELLLYIYLGQVMFCGEKMEFIIQKLIEFGVSFIMLLFFECCGVKLDVECLQKKIQQWQKIVIVVCEQSGCNVVLEICLVMQLEVWCVEQDSGLKFNLYLCVSVSINMLLLLVECVCLLIGLEGGLLVEEIVMIV